MPHSNSAPSRPPARARSTARVAWTLVALIALAGCGEHQSTTQSAAQSAPAPSARTALPPAPAPATPAAPQPTYVLVLTWLSPNQPPATSQTAFHDAASCGRARDAALAEGQRLANDAATTFAAATAKFQSSEHRYVGNSLLAGDAAPTPPVVPKVAAFCTTS